MVYICSIEKLVLFSLYGLIYMLNSEHIIKDFLVIIIYFDKEK